MRCFRRLVPLRVYSWWLKRGCAAVVTLREASSLPRPLGPTHYVMACHDPVEHWCGEPCIHFRKVAEDEVEAVLAVESVHHALLELMGEKADNAWENFHGSFGRAEWLLGLSTDEEYAEAVLREAETLIALLREVI